MNILGFLIIWLVGVLILRPSTNKLLMFIVVLFVVHFVLLLFSKNAFAEEIGILIYISLVLTIAKRFTSTLKNKIVE